MGPTLRLMSYTKDQLEELDNVTLDEALVRLKGPGVGWLTIYDADEKVHDQLEQQLGLHPLALEDSLNQRQRPKMEEYPGHIYFVARAIENLPDGKARDHQSNIFLGDGWVVVIHERPMGLFEPVRDRIRRGRPRIRSNGADYLVYALLDAAMDSLFPALEDVGDQIDKLEEVVRIDDRELDLEKLHSLKQELRKLRRVVWPSRDMLTSLLRDEPAGIKKTTLTYMRDVQDHAVQAMDLIEMHREAVTSLLDLHLTLVSNRMNEVMKVLTIVATIFIPITFLAGIYGMNFDASASPYNMPELSWMYGYPAFLGFTALVVLGELWFFRRKGWI